jgi:hypothetical protein
MRLHIGLLLLPLLLAEPPRRPEAFLNYGVLKWAGDEGWLGTSGGWGATAVLPLTPRLAVDIDVLTARRTEEVDPVRRRRTLISPHLLYRFGAQRLYGYAGAGLGAQIDSFRGRVLVGSPMEREVEGRGAGRTIGVAGGFVANPAGPVLIRVGFYAAFRYVVPNSGVKIGVGYRF